LNEISSDVYSFYGTAKIQYTATKEKTSNKKKKKIIINNLLRYYAFMVYNDCL